MEGPTRIEELKIEIKLAKPEDWEAYRDLRLEAVDSKDAEMFGFTPGDLGDEKKKAYEHSKTESMWREDLSRPNFFVFLVYQNSVSVGMGIAKERNGPEDWFMASGYIRKNLRNGGIGKKLFATRLNKIREMGGKTVTLGVRSTNSKSIHIAESFGFEKFLGDENSSGFYMRLYNVASTEVTAKINEVLNAK